MDHAESYMGFENLQGHGGLWPGCQRGGWYDHSCLFYSHLLQVPPGILETSRLKKGVEFLTSWAFLWNPNNRQATWLLYAVPMNPRVSPSTGPFRKLAALAPAPQGACYQKKWGSRRFNNQPKKSYPRGLFIHWTLRKQACMESRTSSPRNHVAHQWHGCAAGSSCGLKAGAPRTADCPAFCPPEAIWQKEFHAPGGTGPPSWLPLPLRPYFGEDTREWG